MVPAGLVTAWAVTHPWPTSVQVEQDLLLSRAICAIAAAFGLGVPIGDWQRVPGGRSHLMWKLRTTKGVWAVKQLNRSRESWWLEAYELAAEIEQTAFRRGMAIPRPVQPILPAATLLADVPVDSIMVSFQVHEWCDGTALRVAEVTPKLLDWVGESLARLHSIPVPPQRGGSGRAAGLRRGRLEGLARLGRSRRCLDGPPSGRVVVSS